MTLHYVFSFDTWVPCVANIITQQIKKPESFCSGLLHFSHHNGCSKILMYLLSTFVLRFKRDSFSRHNERFAILYQEACSYEVLKVKAHALIITLLRHNHCFWQNYWTEFSLVRKLGMTIMHSQLCFTVNLTKAADEKQLLSNIFFQHNMVLLCPWTNSLTINISSLQQQPNRIHLESLLWFKLSPCAWPQLWWNLFRHLHTRHSMTISCNKDYSAHCGSWFLSASLPIHTTAAGFAWWWATSLLSPLDWLWK